MRELLHGHSMMVDILPPRARCAPGHPAFCRSWYADPAPRIDMCAMSRCVDGGQVAWSGGSEGGSGCKGCHLGSSHGVLDKGKDLCLFASSSPHLSPPGSGSVWNPPLASSSTYSPNLSWIVRSCRKSSASEFWEGTVDRDCRSFVQVLKIRLAPTAMVPPRPGRGWGREGFSVDKGGRGGGRSGRPGYAWHRHGWRGRGVAAPGRQPPLQEDHGHQGGALSVGEVRANPSPEMDREFGTTAAQLGTQSAGGSEGS
jgi:hypothetical protein